MVGIPYLLKTVSSESGGVSPTASVVQTSTGATITITDVNGTTTADITSGISPYEVAVAGGFTGTEEEFNDGLANVGDISAVLDAINGEEV